MEPSREFRTLFEKTRRGEVEKVEASGSTLAFTSITAVVLTITIIGLFYGLSGRGKGKRGGKRFIPEAGVEYFNEDGSRIDLARENLDHLEVVR